MAQDYSTEWRAALIERDMAVAAIVEFLAALDDKEDELTLVHLQKWDGVVDGFMRIPPGEGPSSLEMLRRVAQQLEKKMKR